jgi:hypothetical protein
MPTLHNFTLGLGVVALAGGMVAIGTGSPPGFIAIIWGVLIVCGVIFERFRYKPLVDKPPAGDWVSTTERFVDDETGKPVTVWVDPATGERSYVAD